ncbi:uncharacterized protein LOC102353204 [Latimeria chalumnae]|uniref:uncharacterized protein LOC102353204 n=1 Tax=Latimeria chalumnae TaxID=7897 RepID=UPI0003C1B0EC|nr:PREDICTED: uncharacterized protein LOC102353204 [Latimeria chalumnae]XP_014343149.1 PREDICTED: uncharacterized protein LOC102353204 [Latimeria chalumnae]XP_014343150.1 PREDICTED: uncharacterized protein LOC102353204 [Latimeria chalumnae]XP_014343151.1 PREDICTED: uncharacterized protein LOC102353204 [Latimeria chalumnae]XP_014343152.1 PREDICTED: uncharacterized protein LOC102353204 [Latimeria chalumnae]XP_014343153.1 PREDICTED: uncharacterized protein LOC102353204 [Latimeria chalumnae]|eukprot:XP_005994861.1 PREDICTED: uncharacterized protein LOC102353204 [Latimeria chalumnae]
MSLPRILSQSHKLTSILKPSTLIRTPELCSIKKGTKNSHSEDTVQRSTLEFTVELDGDQKYILIHPNEDIRSRQQIYRLAPEKISPPCGKVTILSIQMDKVADILHFCSQSTIAKTWLNYREIIRKHVRDFRGYEASNDATSFLLVFQNAMDAINCAMITQLAMNGHRWEEELLLLNACKVVWKKSSDGWKPRKIFNGPKLKMGISRGQAKSTYQYKNGQTTYSGTVVKTAEDIGYTAQGGQILVCAKLWSAVPEEQLFPCVSLSYERKVQEGSQEGFQCSLVQVLPDSLAERAYLFKDPS